MAGGQVDPDDELACSTSNDHKLFTEVTTSLYFLYLDTTNDKTRLLVYKKMNIMTHEQLRRGQTGPMSGITPKVNGVTLADNRTYDEQEVRTGSLLIVINWCIVFACP